MLRAVLESGTSPVVEKRIKSAHTLITSRLSLVETARALLRLRALGQASEEQISDAARDTAAVWNHCEVWELTPTVCEMAEQVAPRILLRTLDAIHLATYLLARRNIEGLELLTTDHRLLEATRSA